MDNFHGQMVADFELALTVAATVISRPPGRVIIDAGNKAVGVRMVPGYAPATVNMYDVYHVVPDDQVIDVWPIFPRGPGHNGLVAVPPPL